MIFQDCRGRHDSEGEFVKYLSEGADGFDTCRWIVAQPWSDQRIGTMGLSYAAHCGLVATGLAVRMTRSSGSGAGGPN